MKQFISTLPLLWSESQIASHSELNGSGPLVTTAMLITILLLLGICIFLLFYVRRLKLQLAALQAAVPASRQRKPAKPSQANNVPATEPIMDEQEILDSVEDALKNGEFQFYLQPEVDQFTKQIVGAEALARWVRPGKGVLSPKAFIPALEKSGLISKLDRYIFEQVCIYQRDRLQSKKKAVPISVNLSKEDLRNADLFDFLNSLMEKYKIPASLIHLEIPASAFAEDMDGISTLVGKLREEDFYVGVDNLGQNPLSMDILKDLPMDSMKLDINSIKNPDAQNKQIVSSMLRMGHLNDKNILVGSVETQEQANHLKYIGFRNAQGFLYYKPMPLSEFEELVAGNKKQ